MQKDPTKSVNITPMCVKHYMGICLLMTIISLPSVRSYWNEFIGNELVRNCMSLNRFEKIRQFLHFNDNATLLPKDNPSHDRLHKIRPIINKLLERFALVPLESRLSVDEQICATKARHYLKQYLPLKPHKWGFKFFVLCGQSGFAYNFEIYSGQENTQLMNEPDLGASSNVVVRLCRMIPTNANFRVYFDNYYTSLQLISYLANRGIFSLGTIRRNRIPDSKLPSEVDIKKWKRGDSCEHLGVVNDIDISTTVWKDNKTVVLASSFAGEAPIGTVRRYEKSNKEMIQASCPFVIQEYNKHMGGVDLLDSFLGRYHIKIRSKKWYLRIFYHLLDVTMVNAWILYKRVAAQRSENTSLLTLSQFRIEVATCLCKEMTGVTVKRGRPSSSSVENQLQEKKKKGRTTYVPPKDVRLDCMSHFPEHTDTRQRCKLPGCGQLTFIKCEKCGVYLCFNKNKNCFRGFHVN